MTTPDGSLQVIQSNAIMYEAFRRSVWLNASNRSLESMFDRALKAQVAVLGDSSTIQARTRAQLENEITYTTSDVTIKTLVKMFFNGFDSLAMADYRALQAGGRLESHLAMRLGKKLALHVDSQIAALIAGSTTLGDSSTRITYDTVDGSGNDNKIEVGTATTDFISRTFPYNPTNSSGKDVFADFEKAVKDAHLLLAEKDVVDGEFVGDYGGGQLALMLPLALARVLVDRIADKGELRMAGDVAGQAIQRRGIFGTSAYMGTAFGMADIVGTNSLPAPTGTTNWASYVLPSNGVLQAGFPLLAIDEAMFGQGNTKGAYVYRRTAVGEWYAGVLDPKHIVQITVHAD